MAQDCGHHRRLLFSKPTPDKLQENRGTAWKNTLDGIGVLVVYASRLKGVCIGMTALQKCS